MVFWEGYMSDEMMGLVSPVVIYWLYSGLYQFLDFMNFEIFNKYRLHPRGDEKKNYVSMPSVVRGVLMQQLLQMFVGFLLFFLDPMSQVKKQRPNLRVEIVQFLVAMFVMDTWQYFLHRLCHEVKFLYRHLHSWHHRLVVPYAFGALYNHPIEGLLLDTVGGAISFLASGMHPKLAVFFFCFATMKTVDDHCGVVLPGNLFQMIFKNNAAYHDVHHQLYGLKYNYSQPFFPFWDILLNTHLPHVLTKRVDGGFEAKPVKKPVKKPVAINEEDVKKDS